MFPGNKKLLTLSKIVINIFWYLQLLFLLVLFVYTFILIFDIKVVDTNLLKGFQIHFSRIDFMQPLMYEGKEYSIRLTNGEGRLHIDNFNQNFIYLRILAAFVDSFIYLLILYFLKKIFSNLTKNHFFVPENGEYIKKIGYSIIALAFIPALIHYYTDRLVFESIQIEHVALKTSLDLDYQTILLGILVLVISIVFLRGVELEKDQELTIWPMPIVTNLDVQLAKNKMSLTELSERIGITIANLSILKSGKARAIRFSTLELICKELHCTPGDILEYVPETENEPKK